MSNSSAEGGSASGGKKLSLEPYKGTRDFTHRTSLCKTIFLGVWKKSRGESYGYLGVRRLPSGRTRFVPSQVRRRDSDEQTYKLQRPRRQGSYTSSRDDSYRSPHGRTKAQRAYVPLCVGLAYQIYLGYERPQRRPPPRTLAVDVDMFGVDSVNAEC